MAPIARPGSGERCMAPDEAFDCFKASTAGRLRARSFYGRAATARVTGASHNCTALSRSASLTAVAQRLARASGEP